MIEISEHARNRFFERGGEFLELEDELQNARPWGTPNSNCRFLKLPCGLIAALTSEGPGVEIVKTVLTRKQAARNVRELTYAHRERQKTKKVFYGGRKRGPRKRDQDDE